MIVLASLAVKLVNALRKVLHTSTEKVPCIERQVDLRIYECVRRLLEVGISRDPNSGLPSLFSVQCPRPTVLSGFLWDNLLAKLPSMVPNNEPPPEVPDGYMFLYNISKGAFGNVFAVVDLADIDETYACKAVQFNFHAGLDRAGKKDVVRSAAREAQTIGALEHPNILAIQDWVGFTGLYAC